MLDNNGKFIDKTAFLKAVNFYEKSIPLDVVVLKYFRDTDLVRKAADSDYAKKIYNIALNIGIKVKTETNKPGIGRADIEKQYENELKELDAFIKEEVRLFNKYYKVNLVLS